MEGCKQSCFPDTHLKHTLFIYLIPLLKNKQTNKRGRLKPGIQHGQKIFHSSLIQKKSLKSLLFQYSGASWQKITLAELLISPRRNGHAGRTTHIKAARRVIMGWLTTSWEVFPFICCLWKTGGRKRRKGKEGTGLIPGDKSIQQVRIQPGARSSVFLQHYKILEERLPVTALTYAHSCTVNGT